MTFWCISNRLIKALNNQQKCPHEPSYVQLRFNFQNLNVQNLYKCNNKFKRTKKTQNPSGNHLFEIRNSPYWPTTNENEMRSFVQLWLTRKITETTSRFTFNLKIQKHVFTYATVNAEMWRANTCNKH